MHAEWLRAIHYMSTCTHKKSNACEPHILVSNGVIGSNAAYDENRSDSLFPFCSHSLKFTITISAILPFDSF